MPLRLRDPSQPLPKESSVISSPGGDAVSGLSHAAQNANEPPGHHDTAGQNRIGDVRLLLVAAEDLSWVHSYLKEALEPPGPPSQTQTQRLLVRAKRGDVAAADRLFLGHRGVVLIRAERFLYEKEMKDEGCSFLEILQLGEGVPSRLGPLILIAEEGLRDAINHSEITNRLNFRRYAGESIDRALSKGIQPGSGGGLAGVREPRRPMPPHDGALESLLPEGLS